jgi:hypothetical protein
VKGSTTVLLVAAMFGAACAPTVRTVNLRTSHPWPDGKIVVDIREIVAALSPTRGCSARPAGDVLWFLASPDHAQVLRYEFVITAPTRGQPCYVGFVRTVGPGGSSDAAPFQFAIERPR